MPGSPFKTAIPTASECAHTIPRSREIRHEQRFSIFVRVTIRNPARYSFTPSLTAPRRNGGS